MLIYNALRVAAILHNRLLMIYDGYDKFDWETCDPDEDEPENPVAPAPEVPDDFDEMEQWLQENLHRESFLSILSVPKRTQFSVTIGR